MTIDKGSADGWPLSVNSLSVTLLQNNLHGGSMGGDLIIPFLGKDPLAYSAELAETEGHLHYKFTVGIDGKREFTAPFSAKITLTQAIVALEKKDYTAAILLLIQDNISLGNLTTIQSQLLALMNQRLTDVEAGDIGSQVSANSRAIRDVQQQLSSLATDKTIFNLVSEIEDRVAQNERSIRLLNANVGQVAKSSQFPLTVLVAVYTPFIVIRTNTVMCDYKFTPNTFLASRGATVSLYAVQQAFKYKLANTDPVNLDTWRKIMAGEALETSGEERLERRPGRWRNQDAVWTNDKYVLPKILNVVVDYKTAGGAIIESRNNSAKVVDPASRDNILSDFIIQYDPVPVSAVTSMAAVAATIASALVPVIGPGLVTLEGYSLTYDALFGGIASALKSAPARSIYQAISALAQGPEQKINGRYEHNLNESFVFDINYPSSQDAAVNGDSDFVAIPNSDDDSTGAWTTFGGGFVDGYTNTFIQAFTITEGFICSLDTVGDQYVSTCSVSIDMTSIDPTCELIAVNGVNVLQWDSINSNWNAL